MKWFLLKHLCVQIMTWLSVTEYLYYKWPRIWSTCRKHGCHQELLTFPGHHNSLPVLVGFVLLDL